MPITVSNLGTETNSIWLQFILFLAWLRLLLLLILNPIISAWYSNLNPRFRILTVRWPCISVLICSRLANIFIALHITLSNQKHTFVPSDHSVLWSRANSCFHWRNFGTGLAIISKHTEQIKDLESSISDKPRIGCHFAEKSRGVEKTPLFLDS